MEYTKQACYVQGYLYFDEVRGLATFKHCSDVDALIIDY